MRIAADNATLHVALGLMRAHGGAFAKTIAAAYQQAPTLGDQARLRMAFGDLMCQYGATIDPVGLQIENDAFLEDALESIVLRLLA
jgi:hypothetical protein